MPAAVAAMARPGEIEGRVSGILDDARCRDRPAPALVRALLVAAVLAAAFTGAIQLAPATSTVIAGATVDDRSTAVPEGVLAVTPTDALRRIDDATANARAIIERMRGIAPGGRRSVHGVSGAAAPQEIRIAVPARHDE